MTEDPFEEMEARLAFHEDAIAELNLTVTRQQRVIDGLLRELQHLRRHLCAIAPQSGPADDIPPHY